MLTADPNGIVAALRPGITLMLLTQPSRPGTPLFLMKTQWPAVMSVFGPMNQPVPIHAELSRATISSEAMARYG